MTIILFYLYHIFYFLTGLILLRIRLLHTISDFQNSLRVSINQHIITCMSRVFVGIPISDELKTKIEAWDKEHKVFPVRWIQQKNLHITLVTPWQEKNVPLVLKKLEAFKGKFPNINLEFKSIGFGNDKRSPRLIWATGDTPDDLIKLVKQLHLALGVELPSYEFLLHATLAKFRPEDFPKFPVKKLEEKVGWKMRVEKLVLFKSKLRAVGADYIPLGEVEI